MPLHRLKHSFSAGEMSPLMNARLDFKRYNNGCKKLHNMLCTTQGPVTRRSGFQFIYDLTSLGLDPVDGRTRLVPFTFNEEQAYAMIFFVDTNGDVILVFGDKEGLIVYPDPVPTECPPGTPLTGTNPGDVVTLNLGPVASKGHDEGDETDKWDIDHFDWAQSADEMYIAQSGKQPHVIKRWSNTCWELVALTFTDQPADWTDEAGWPERVTFHQQRLAYACNLLKRQTVWMSKAGDFNDFGQEAEVIDSDAITFTLDSGTQNKIVWMNSGKSLNIGTIGNEWTVSGATRNALTPDNVLAQRQTNNGGEPNKPLMVGITTLFVERYGRAVNEFVYDYTYDSYKTSDMSVLSNHITEHYSIKDWTYQQTPDSIIWTVREDGNLAGITYQRSHEVVGWHVHSTNGEFKAITSIPGDQREDELWTVVKRVIGGVDKYYVEKKHLQFKSDSAVDSRFLDASSSYVGAPASVFSGLDHLETEIVQIIADGTVHPDQVVVGGEVTLNREYSNVTIGFHSNAEVWPNLPELPTSLGSAFGRMQRVTKLSIDFYNSLGITIGKWDSEDGESTDELPFRCPVDLTNQAVPLYTGINNVDFMEGFDRQTTYFLRQTQALPMTVRGVTDTIEVFE